MNKFGGAIALATKRDPLSRVKGFGLGATYVELGHTGSVYRLPSTSLEAFLSSDFGLLFSRHVLPSFGCKP